MKKFVDPKFELEAFDVEDVLTTSETTIPEETKDKDQSEEI